MNRRNPSVDGYIRKNKQWQEHLSALREIVLQTELVEEIKWRAPCYTIDGKNVAFIGCFKDNCVLSFIKGALLKDPKGILVKPGENTQSARVARFTTVEQIKKHAKTLKSYLEEAIAIEQAGLKVAFKKEHAIPAELQAKFDENSEFEIAFTSLTPGRQRGYILHFSSAKQPQTRISRIEKCMPKIFTGKGFDE